MRTRLLVLVALSALAFLPWGVVHFSIRALPRSRLLNPLPPPNFWIPQSVFTIPVAFAEGVPIHLTAQQGLVDQGVEPIPSMTAATTERLWQLAEPASVRIRVLTGAHTGFVGGGAIVSPDGLVLTASHVLQGNIRSIAVIWDDGQSRSASIEARDPSHDLALLRIGRVGPECFHFLRVAGRDYEEIYGLWPGNPAILMGFGASSHQLRAIRANFGTGILSTEVKWKDPKQQWKGIGRFYEFIGIPVEGDSGSPVLDERGTVVAIVSAISVDGTQPPIFLGVLPYEFSGGLTF